MRFHRVVATVLIGLLWGAGASGAAAASEVFTVRDVPVDVTAETAAAAREAAHGEGQASALRRLLARLLPRDELARVPAFGPAEAIEFVTDFEVADERTSDVRYLASMTVRFNPQAVRRFVQDNGLALAETQSKPVVVIPVYGAAAEARLWDEGNAWWAAWSTRPPGEGLVPLVAPLGDLADIAGVNAAQALAGDRDRLAALAARYGADDVLITQAVLSGDAEAGQASLQVGTSRIGKRQQSTVIENFAQVAGEAPADFLLRAAEAVADEVQEEWKRRNLLRPGLALRLTAVVPLRGLDDWLEVRKRLAGVAGVRRSDVVGLARDRGELEIDFIGEEQQLVLAMAQSDLDLSFDQGEGWRLRIRGAETAPSSAESLIPGTIPAGPAPSTTASE